MDPAALQRLLTGLEEVVQRAQRPSALPTRDTPGVDVPPSTPQIVPVRPEDGDAGEPGIIWDGAGWRGRIVWPAARAGRDERPMCGRNG